MRCGASCRCTPFVSVSRHHLGTLLWTCPTKATDYRHSDREGFHVGGTAMIRATVFRALVLTPVTLPPGRRRLATIPAFTGSVPAEKTMGIVVVAVFAARAVTVPIGVTITAT